MLTLKRSLLIWGSALMLAGHAAGSLIPPVVRWMAQISPRDPLVSELAYYLMGFIGQVGIPLGAALFAVSFVVARIPHRERIPLGGDPAVD